MPKTYELMQAYRDWWQANDGTLSAYGTLPSAQAVIIAAGWAQHVLEIYQDGASVQPTAERIEPTAPAQPVGGAS